MREHFGSDKIQTKVADSKIKSEILVKIISSWITYQITTCSPIPTSQTTCSLNIPTSSFNCLSKN